MPAAAPKYSVLLSDGLDTVMNLPEEVRTRVRLRLDEAVRGVAESTSIRSLVEGGYRIVYEVRCAPEQVPCLVVHEVTRAQE